MADATNWHCPAHAAPLDERGDELVCPHGDAYPVRGGIPRFVDDAGYAAAFGAQWNAWRRTQLDSYTGVPLSRDRARRCLGDDGWSALRGANVLEVGCGAGRFTEVLLDQGANVTSVDLSSAVDANAGNFPPGERHRIAQADVRALPFAPRSFDVVFCLGVIQHTPNSEETLAALYAQVKPGGRLAVDHYTYRAAWFLSTQPLVRRVMTRMPPERTVPLTERMVDRLWPLHSKLRRGRKVVERVSPVQTYFDLFPDLDDEQQRAWAVLDTHDALTDRYKWFRTRGQLERALLALGAEDVACWRGGNGVEGRARRPLPSAESSAAVASAASRAAAMPAAASTMNAAE
jgi:SAM-dependent methyltransferase